MKNTSWFAILGLVGLVGCGVQEEDVVEIDTVDCDMDRDGRDECDGEDKVVSLSYVADEVDELAGLNDYLCIEAGALAWADNTTSMRGCNSAGSDYDWVHNINVSKTLYTASGIWKCNQVNPADGPYLQGNWANASVPECADEDSPVYSDFMCWADLTDDTADEFVKPDGHGGLYVSVTVDGDMLLPGPEQNTCEFVPL